MVSSNVIAAIAGGISLTALGYCIYFDRKRRSDPDFKKKLIESWIKNDKLNCFIKINDQF
jgi:hypothetical protein